MIYIFEGKKLDGQVFVPDEYTFVALTWCTFLVVSSRDSLKGGIWELEAAFCVR